MEQHDWIYYGFVGGCIAFALFIRIRQIGRMRPLRLGTLWIVPVIFLVLAAMLFWQFPPAGLDWLWIAAGCGVGSAMGWYRARLVEIGVDAETGRLYQRSSPGALIFLGVLVLVRWAVRSAVMLGDAQWQLGAMLISDIFIAIAAGALCAYRIEILLRARPLVRAGVGRATDS